MRGLVDLHQPRLIHRRVDLRGGQRGVTEQFLNRAQIPARLQKVRGEAMAQRMGRRRGGQAQRQPRPFHRLLNHARIQPLAARTDKELMEYDFGKRDITYYQKERKNILATGKMINEALAMLRSRYGKVK